MIDEEGDYDFEDDTLVVLSEEEDLADTTVNQSTDSLFRFSSGSNLYVPSARMNPTFSPRKIINQECRTVGDRPKFNCHLCSSKLKTEVGLQRHVLNHKFSVVSSRRPSPEQLKNRCIQDAAQICMDMEHAPMSTIISGDSFSKFAEKISEVSNPEPSSKFCEFIEVCVESLVQPVCLSKSVAPTSVKKIVRKHLHTALADTAVMDLRRTNLLSLVNSDAWGQDIAENYLQDFCRRLVISTATFIINLMREAPDDQHTLMSSKYSKDDFDSLFSQQTLHNILGFTVKAVLKRSRQYMGNPKWDNIQKVMLLRFEHIGTMEARPHESSFWTALLGRKSYTFVSEPVLNFFVEIAKILCYVETSTGSIPIKEVLNKVITSPVLVCQWFDVVGSGLGENDAIFVLRLLVTSLCKTFGRGILLRRTNQQAAERKKSSGGVTSVSKRAQLTR